MAATPTVAASVGQHQRHERRAARRRRAPPRRPPSTTSSAEQLRPRSPRPCRGRSPPPSRPESRRPSRAPLSASIANARDDREQRGEQHRDPEQARARPGARMPRSGSSANANSSSTISPNGRICCERDPRPGLDAQVLARDEPRPRARGHARSPPAAGRRAARSRRGDRGLAVDEHDLAVGERRGRSSSSCDASSTVRPSAGAARDDVVERPRGPSASSPACGSSSSSSSRVARPARPRARAGGAARPRAGGARTSASGVEPDAARARRRRRRSSRPAARAAKRRFSRDGEVVVAEGLVADEREVAPRARADRRRGRGRAPRLARVQRHQAGEEPQQRGLARAVRAREEHDLARVDVEVDAGERREAAEQADGGAETDDGRHTRLRAVGRLRVYERFAPARSNRRREAAERGR